MRLHIDDNLRVEDVQDRFAKCFPFLKLAFYSKAHKPFESSDEATLIDSKQLIGDIRTSHENGVLEIKSWFTTQKVEQELKQKFGLNVQVFRRQPDGSWVQCALSDHLANEQQSDFSFHQMHSKR